MGQEHCSYFNIQVLCITLESFSQKQNFSHCSDHHFQEVYLFQEAKILGSWMICFNHSTFYENSLKSK